MNVNNLSVNIDSNDSIKNVTFILNPTDKIGLVGSNGRGKTTF